MCGAGLIGDSGSGSQGIVVVVVVVVDFVVVAFVVLVSTICSFSPK